MTSQYHPKNKGRYTDSQFPRRFISLYANQMQKEPSAQPSEEPPDCQKSKPHDFLAWSNVAISLAMLVATIAIACATIELSNISQDQRDILEKTDQTSRLRDRAFIYFGDPVLVQWPPAPKPTEVIGTNISYTNAGNMPGRRVVVQYSCMWPLIKEAPPDPYIGAVWQKLEATNVIGPKQSFSLQGCGIPFADFQGAMDGKRRITVAIRATYIDGFDLKTERVTEMTRVIRFGSQKEMSMGFIGQHNCSDDDCPK